MLFLPIELTNLKKMIVTGAGIIVGSVISHTSLMKSKSINLSEGQEGRIFIKGISLDSAIPFHRTSSK